MCSVHEMYSRNELKWMENRWINIKWASKYFQWIKCARISVAIYTFEIHTSKPVRAQHLWHSVMVPVSLSVYPDNASSIPHIYFARAAYTGHVEENLQFQNDTFYSSFDLHNENHLNIPCPKHNTNVFISHHFWMNQTIYGHTF